MVVSQPSRRQPTSSKKKLDPAPILIELSLQALIVKAGLAGQPSAHLILPLPRLTKPALSITMQDYYQSFSPVIQQLLQLLPQEVIPISKRKAVVLFDSGLTLHEPLRKALLRIILDAIQCPAVTFFSSLLMIGLSLMLPSTGAESTCLAVYMTEQEAHCIIYSSHQAWPFTYQSTGIRADYQPAATVLETIMHWTSAEGVQQVALAILKCLEACPRDIRRTAIGNLFFCGSATNDAIGVRIARQVQSILRGQDELTGDTITGTPTSSDSSAMAFELVSVPVSIRSLQPLAESVSVIALPDGIRPDLAVWIGGSIWVNRLHQRDSDAPEFQWIDEV